MTKQEVKQMIADMAKSKGLSDTEVAFLLAIAEKESGFDPNAKNPYSSASGVFQYTKQTWESTKNYRNNPYASPFDPEANIETMINQYIDWTKPQVIKKLKMEGLDFYDNLERTLDLIYKCHHDGGIFKRDGSYIPDTPEYRRSIPKLHEYFEKYKPNDTSPSSTNTLTPHTHTVQPGDTLSKIAEEYGVSVDDLLRANPWIKNPDHIEVGWKIKIPGYAEKVRRNLREGTRRIDPLVIDLDGDGIELRDINESNAMFDLTGSGFANKVGWVSPDDGFLVWDRNNDNKINDITEMFGNEKESGFKALALYDTNHDGKIDAFDDVFKNLKVWAGQGCRW